MKINRESCFENLNNFLWKMDKFNFDSESAFVVNPTAHVNLSTEPKTSSMNLSQLEEICTQLPYEQKNCKLLDIGKNQDASLFSDYCESINNNFSFSNNETETQKSIQNSFYLPHQQQAKSEKKKVFEIKKSTSAF